MMAADVGEQRLHTTAHRAIKRGAWDDAQRHAEVQRHTAIANWVTHLDNSWQKGLTGLF